MRQINKMVRAYKIGIKISIITLIIAFPIFIGIGIYVLVKLPIFWWVSLMLFALVIICSIISYFSLKRAKTRINTMENEIAEFEKIKSK